MHINAPHIRRTIATFIRNPVDSFECEHPVVVKTTVTLEDELWKKFSIKVIDKYGGRKKTDIFEALADAFVNAPQKTIEEALQDWLKNQTKRKMKSR